jgi:hypothetical protein
VRQAKTGLEERNGKSRRVGVDGGQTELAQNQTARRVVDEESGAHRDEGSRLNEEKIMKRNELATTITHSIWKKCGEEMAIARWSTLRGQNKKVGKIDIGGMGMELYERVTLAIEPLGEGERG